MPTRWVLPRARQRGIVVNIPEMRMYLFPPRIKPGGEVVVRTWAIAIGERRDAQPDRPVHGDGEGQEPDLARPRLDLPDHGQAAPPRRAARARQPHGRIPHSAVERLDIPSTAPIRPGRSAARRPTVVFGCTLRTSATCMPCSTADERRADLRTGQVRFGGRAHLRRGARRRLPPLSQSGGEAFRVVQAGIRPRRSTRSASPGRPRAHGCPGRRDAPIWVAAPRRRAPVRAPAAAPVAARCARRQPRRAANTSLGRRRSQVRSASRDGSVATRRGKSAPCPSALSSSIVPPSATSSRWTM